jgi:2-polyprenyl-3-methyl-5-hydroxy-6-metoxy-1,4-benzoquinol methylase
VFLVDGLLGSYLQVQGPMLARKRVPEIMDDPLLDRDLHLAALRGLERLNSISNSKQILAEPIKKLAGRLGHDQPLKVLDIACGAGDLPIQLSNYFRRGPLKIEVHGLDVSDLAISYASKKNDEAGARCQFSKLDVITQDLPVGFDIITTSLFTHHLDPPEIENLLSKMAARAKYMVLVNDLERSLVSLLSVSLATQLLTSSEVVRHDGPASVRAAFTAQEMLTMAHSAGLASARVKLRWPCRMLLTWQKDTL